jgi:cell division protein FtsB
MRDDTRFGDFTRPISRDKQLVKGRGKRGFVAIGAMVITAALVAALFVLPVKAWLRQQDDIARKQKELTALEAANNELADEVNRLQTPEGIKEAAREEIGYVQRGEIRLSVLPAPDAPITMPDGWPYDAVAQIVAVRSQGAITP